MLKLLITTLLLTSFMHASDIKPVATLKVSGLVSDFVIDGNLLYVATDTGTVDIIDLYTQKITSEIKLPTITTLQGEIPSRIHAIDRHEGKTLLVSSASNAYRNVWIHNAKLPLDKKLTKIINKNKHLMPKKAFFTADGKVIFGTFGSDITLYDSSENYQLYQTHVSESTMGGMALSSNKKKMVISDESGSVRLIDVNTSQIEKTFYSEHVDNIYSVAFAKNNIITAGQDRRVGVYPAFGDAYHIKSDFLVYCVGLSPSGKKGIYSSGTAHHLQLFNLKDKQKLQRLVGHHATPNKIHFINEDLLISSGDEETIYFWNIAPKSASK